MSSCAVIGANGFLGRAIVVQLTAAGHTVHCVYNKSSTSLAEDCNKIHVDAFIDGSKPVDHIFFAAGSFSSTHKELIFLNCELLIVLVDRYPRARIIYISSTNVYGFHNDIITESSSFNSPALYGQSKLAGEFIVSSAQSYAIVRLAYLYGNGLSNGSFLYNIVRQAALDKKIILFGKGLREQDYLHVNDAAALCIKVMNCGFNDIFLGATGKSHSNLQVAEVIASNLPACQVIFDGKDSGTSFYFDPSETFRKLGWTPQQDFKLGLKNMIS